MRAGVQIRLGGCYALLAVIATRASVMESQWDPFKRDRGGTRWILMSLVGVPVVAEAAVVSAAWELVSFSVSTVSNGRPLSLESEEWWCRAVMRVTTIGKYSPLGMVDKTTVHCTVRLMTLWTACTSCASHPCAVPGPLAECCQTLNLESNEWWCCAVMRVTTIDRYSPLGMVDKTTVHCTVRLMTPWTACTSCASPPCAVTVPQFGSMISFIGDAEALNTVLRPLLAVALYACRALASFFLSSALSRLVAFQESNSGFQSSWFAVPASPARFREQQTSFVAAAAASAAAPRTCDSCGDDASNLESRLSESVQH